MVIDHVYYRSIDDAWYFFILGILDPFSLPPADLAFPFGVRYRYRWCTIADI
ncbi:hypothetical protein D1BOALGB6SA_7931 [Olavius sp. associated proteobacterium Delta 1]|nr:hypothetical protein D1BOALGB6SA_7931 [Olavius sp. associated proteobacterium Delta 1]